MNEENNSYQVTNADMVDGSVKQISYVEILNAIKATKAGRQLVLLK